MKNQALIQITPTQWQWADNDLAKLAKKEFEENVYTFTSNTTAKLLGETLAAALQQSPDTEKWLLIEVLTGACKKLEADKRLSWEFIYSIIEPDNGRYIDYDWRTGIFTVKALGQV